MNKKLYIYILVILGILISLFFQGNTIIFWESWALVSSWSQNISVLNSKIRPVISEITWNSIRVEWEKINWFNWFIVHYWTKSASGSMNYENNSDTIDSTWTILNNLISNKTYYLIITSFDKDANEIPVSQEIKFTTLNSKTNNLILNSSPENKNEITNNVVNNTTASISSANKNNSNIWTPGSTINNATNWNSLDISKIEKLPKTWPEIYIILFSALLISFLIIKFSIFKKDRIKG